MKNIQGAHAEFGHRAFWIKKEPKSPYQRLVQRTKIGGTSYDDMDLWLQSTTYYGNVKAVI